MGPLAGLTVAVKDLYAVAGQRIGAGNPAWLAEAAVQPRHAVAVRRLLDAGAAVRGIARTDEFAYSIAGCNDHYGTPPNPAAPDRISGGSSSGSAAAVALGQADIGLGTDTGGSIRVPASYQGLWGVRTTHGLVNRTGLLGLAERFDTVGWLTRDPDVLARVAAVLAPDADAPVAASPIALDGLEELVAPDALSDWNRAMAALTRRLDAPVERVRVDGLADVQRAFAALQGWQAWREHGVWVAEHWSALGPAVRDRFEVASRVTRAEADAARDEVERFRALVDGLAGDRPLLLPSASGSAPRRDADPTTIDRVRRGTMRLTVLAGVSGRPAISAPVLTASGLPLGLCAIGPRRSDRTLITWAARALSPLAPAEGGR